MKTPDLHAHSNKKLRPRPEPLFQDVIPSKHAPFLAYAAESSPLKKSDLMAAAKKKLSLNNNPRFSETMDKIKFGVSF